MAETVPRSRYLARWSALDSEFAAWRARYEDISRFILPVSGRFTTSERNTGTKSFNNIYDSTGTQALGVLSAGLMAGMTSPARPWFRLSTSDPDLMKYAPVKVWLDDVTRILQAIFARSNTYRALHSMYEELGAYGTAVSIVAEDFQSVIHHYPLTAGEYRLATNYKGEVDCMYRKCVKTVAELVKEFGLEACSVTVRGLFDSGALDTKVPIIHVIEPRADRDPTKRDAKNMPWRSLYFEEGGNDDKYLRESGFKSFRVLAPRWTTWGGDTYGISPSMLALGDIRQLQHQQLRKAQGIDKMVDPPLILPVSAKNGMHNFLPGGTSYIDVNGPGAVQSAFQVNLNLSYLLEDIRDVRERINAVFYADLFKMLAMNDAQRGQMTATEVAERHEEKLLMLGPVLERQHNELLDPKIELTFMQALEAGILPAPPKELHGHELSVEFVSMLAQAQRAIGTNGIDRFVMSLGQVAAVKPDVLDKFDADEWADTYSDMLGVDPSLIVASDKVAIVRKNRAQQQQAMQQTAMAESASKSAANLAGADTGGQNALTDVMHNLTGYT
jgi:hypothetical protein